MTNDFRNELTQAALDMGAIQAKIFGIDDIYFDPRTLLKCLFGCRAGIHYCPTAQDVSTATTFMDIIRKYRWGLIIRTGDLKTGQEITLALEKKAFLKGYYFAFGATECAICKTCNRTKDKPCVGRGKLRPPFYSLGIDVYKTVRKLGWELEVVQNEGDPAQNITAVFVE